MRQIHLATRARRNAEMDAAINIAVGLSDLVPIVRLIRSLRALIRGLSSGRVSATKVAIDVLPFVNSGVNFYREFRNIRNLDRELVSLAAKGEKLISDYKLLVQDKHRNLRNSQAALGTRACRERGFGESFATYNPRNPLQC